MYLREISKKDLEIINKWRNDKNIISKLGAPFRYIDLSIDEIWYETYLNNRNNTIRCAITDEKDLILGLVSLTNIDYLNKSAILHIMVGPNNQNKGVGTFGIKEILNHAFLNYNLQRVELEVLEDNEIAKKVYEKVGFQKEGIKRNVCYKNGKYKNMIIMSILKDEFLV